MQEQNDNLIDIFVLLYKRRRTLVISCLLAGIVTAGASLLLPNYYQASTQFYAASPDLALPDPIGNVPDQKRIYGNDYDVDRLISLSKSNVVRNYLIDSFDLFTHYEIDPDKPKGKYKLMLKLDKLYNTTKTKYDAINLAVEDKSPDKATDMANAAREKINELAQEMIKESQAKLIERYRDNVNAKQKQYNAISDSLKITREEYKIFNTQSQGEAFGSTMVDLEGGIQNYNARLKVLKSSSAVPKDSIVITEAKLAGLRKQYEKLSKDIDSYNKGYTDILKYERMLKDFGDQLNLDKERLKQLESAYNSKVSAIHIVERAETPVHKSRPKRSIIVLGAVFLTFILMSLWLVLQEQFQKMGLKEKLANG